MNTMFFDDLNARIGSFLKQTLQQTLQQTPAAELQAGIKTLVSSSLSRLDLVTREEFDIQAKVLARTREKLSLLEARIAALERRPGDPT